MFATSNGQSLISVLLLVLLGNIILGVSLAAAQGDYRYEVPDELNRDRIGVGLPPLKGSFIHDISIVNEECKRGQQHSCLILNKLMEGCSQYCNQTSNIRDSTDCYSSLCIHGEKSKSSIQDRETGRRGGGSNNNDADEWGEKKKMYECIEGCARHCKYLEGFSRQECSASQQRCEANCPRR